MDTTVTFQQKGGQARSRKKTKACRQNARRPRPGRKEFNRIVRVVAMDYPQLASQSTSRVMSEIIFRFEDDAFPISNERAQKIIDAAKRLQSKP